MTDSILDPLREAIEKQRARESASWSDASWNQALDEALAAIDAFEAAHPGLTDRTEPCVKCGAPTHLRHDGGKVICTDKRPGGVGYLCPACAKECE